MKKDRPKGYLMKAPPTLWWGLESAAYSTCFKYKGKHDFLLVQLRDYYGLEFWVMETLRTSMVKPTRYTQETHSTYSANEWRSGVNNPRNSGIDGIITQLKAKIESTNKK